MHLVRASATRVGRRIPHAGLQIAGAVGERVVRAALRRGTDQNLCVQPLRGIERCARIEWSQAGLALTAGLAQCTECPEAASLRLHA
ncbi:hypothetical protein D3C76_853610 [compost metagenome]